MGKCLPRHRRNVYSAWDLVFTPDGNGLLSASSDNTVMHWDVSWLKSAYDGQMEDSIRFEGSLSLCGPQSASTTQSVFFRSPFMPFSIAPTSFLYPPTAFGLRLAHGMRLLEYGIPRRLHCGVSCMVMEKLCLLISVEAGITWLSRMGREK